MEVVFTEEHIRFQCYEFRGATVHPTGTITPAQTRDADWTAIRPELRTTGGETLFIPAAQRSEFERFCVRNSVIGRPRFDAWGDLLEPFLDTWFDPEHERSTLTRLRDAGFPSWEVTEIRRRLTPLMHAYNFDAMVWEWAYLGLYDLLNAANAPVIDPTLQNALGDPTDFYGWAMRIADRTAIQKEETDAPRT
jgi:hypothetical protein